MPLATAATGSLLAVLPPEQPRAPAAEPARADAARSYGRIPLSFEANGRRTDGRVKYLARGPGYTLFLTPRESVVSLEHDDGRRAVIRTSLVGAAADPAVEGARRLPGKINSFVGRRSQWRTGIPAYREVRHRSVYPGIDLVHHGRQSRLEYDFVVRPGANPERPRLRITGARRLSVDAAGNLVLDTAAGTLRHLRPVAYQRIGGERRRVAASYVLDGHEVGFRVGRHDPARTLVIDPVLSYSTYLGGDSDSEAVWGVAVDGAGSAYLTGHTGSTDFPTVAGGLSTSSDGNGDAFVTKLSPGGTSLEYSTYLGSENGDEGVEIAVDGDGNAYVIGYTGSGVTVPFPTTEGAYDTSHNGAGDAFLAKLAPDGASLVFSTFYGGNDDDFALGLALDPAGAVYVAGQTSSTTLTTTGSAIQPGPTDGGDAFFAHFSADGSSLLYATYYGGANFDGAADVAVDRKDATGNAVIVGTTWSDDFPTQSAYDGTLNGTGDAFLLVLDPQASGAASRLYSTYHGGAGYDTGEALAVRSGENTVPPTYTDAYISGSTNGSSFSQIAGPGGNDDVYVTRMQLDGSAPFYSGYIGGTAGEQVSDLALDGQSNPYLTGTTSSTDFPTRNALFSDPESGSANAFVTKITGTYGLLVYSTFLGDAGGSSGSAIAAEPGGAVYVGGKAATGFPVLNPLKSSPSGGADGFVAKLAPRTATITSGPSGPTGETDAVFTFSVAETTSYSFRCRLTGESDFTNCTSPKSYPGLADGAYVFEVKARDDAGTEAPAVSRSFTVDTAPPTAPLLTAPADGASVPLTRPTLEWSAATDALTPVSGYELHVDGAKAADVAAGACTSGTCSAQVPSELANGPHTWFVRARDAAGNAGDSAARSFTVVAPPAAALTIAPNPALVDRPVTFDGSASRNADGGPVARYEWDLDGDGTFETDTGATPTASRSYSAPGTVPVQLRVTDGIGLTATAAGELRVNQVTTTGQFGVSINGGAQYTRTPSVTVTAVFPASITGLLFSNDGGFFAPSQFAPQRETRWRLDSSGPERLPKIVYVRFLTGPIVSETHTDDIILDETPPRVTQAAVAPSAGAAAASAAAVRRWRVRVRATDSNSGVARVQVTANKRRPGRLLAYKRTLTVRSAKRPSWVRARDRAGNFSRWRKAR